jgi:hypothetical protein
VVTDLAIMMPDENGELQVTALHPGVELQDVRDNTAGRSRQPPASPVLLNQPLKNYASCMKNWIPGNLSKLSGPCVSP